MKHEWVVLKELGFKHLTENWLTCRQCGAVQNDLNKNRDNCRGKVKVTLR